jgi:hypothetical protein
MYILDSEITSQQLIDKIPEHLLELDTSEEVFPEIYKSFLKNKDMCTL